MAMEPHAKIINAVAKKALAPHGFFRKGSSRIWLQDNGWYLTMVEFQPSGFSKGTYLNVAMHFLWGVPLSEGAHVLSLDYGDRVMPPDVPTQFISYTGDDALFTHQVEMMANAAVRIAAEYKRCVDLDYARKLICAGEPITAGWYEYNRAMLCFLAGDVQEGLRHIQHFSAARQNWNWYWESGLWKICEQEIPERCNTPEAARKFVIEKIQANRAQMLTQASYKGLRKEPYNG
ncbi:MAG: hypothetical protein IJA83_04300 [Clostridia bacterium]|nr:hypothetical protein [Clostridia bacterium]